MKRLTKKEKLKLSHGEEIIICKHNEKDCNDSCMKIKPCAWYKKVQEKLWEYENAEENGLLFRLPCKAGDTVYAIDKNNIQTLKVKNRIALINGDLHIFIENSRYADYVCFNDLGKTVFLAKEDAERKLEKIKVDK